MSLEQKWLVRMLLAVMMCIGALLPLTAFAGIINSFYVCRRMPAPPRIDGTIVAREWTGTDEAGPLPITGTDAAAPVATHFRIGFDSEKLYFAITCQETKPESLVANVTVRDSSVYSDDCVELILDPLNDHIGTLAFIMNALGTVCDFRYGDIGWHADVQIAARQSGDLWSIELAVPFAELGRSTPKPGEVWGLNVFRTRRADGYQKMNWANAGGNFTDPELLGHLLFDGPDATVPTLNAAHPIKSSDLCPELARLGTSFESEHWSELDNMLAEEQTVRSSLVTPHIQMAGPFPGGPVRALALIKVPGTGQEISPGTRARDFAELAQRFSIDCSAVFFNDSGICGGETGRRRLRALLQNDYDLFIVSGCAPEVVPENQLRDILGRVSKGTGLLYVGESRSWLSDNYTSVDAPVHFETCVPMKELNGFQRMAGKGITGLTDGANPLISCHKIGDGRYARICYPDRSQALTPYFPLNDESWNEYDYWIGLAGFVASWCAGRDPDVTLQLPEKLEFQRADLPGACRVGISVSSPGKTTIRAHIRQGDGSRTQIWDTSLAVPSKGAQTDATIAIPVLPCGSYDLEVQALREGCVIGFSAQRFSVRGPDHIESFSIDRDYAETGEYISGKFTAVRLDRLDQAVTRAELIASDGRVIARRDDPAAGQEVERQFSFLISSDTTIDMRVRVSVIDSKGIVCFSSKRFKVPNRRRDQFNMIMWDAPDDPVGVYAYQNLKNVGFNASLALVGNAVTDWTDFSVVPYTTRITNERDSSGIMNKGCWNNVAAISERISEMADRQAENWKRGVFAFSLGDENDLLGCCLDPACLEAYRRYLEEQYKTIDALNASWGENYKSFDEVQLLEGDDFFKDSAAFRTGKYARWFDRRRFAQVNYANLCGRFARAYTQLDPKAITGFEGAGRFGEDIDSILDNVGLWTTYNSVLDDILRTLAPPGLIRGHWMGYSKTADSLNAFAWRSICMGANSLWWWRWDNIGKYRGFVNAAFDLWPATQSLADEMKIVRDGLGQLLMNAQLENDGVAILYSVESAIADELPSEQPFSRGATAHSAFVHMLKDSGVQYKYVTPRSITSGELKKYRVLLLPHAVAMSTETTDAIREFVRQGGTLIADLRPAIMDTHGNTLSEGALDDVFGVKRAGDGRAVFYNGSLNVNIDNNDFSVPKFRAVLDADYAASDANVRCKASGVPLFFTNQFGQGRAILLNCTLDYFENTRGEATAAAIQTPIIAACRDAGIQLPAEIGNASGGPPSMTELTRWKIGENGKLISLRTDLSAWSWGSTGPGPRQNPQHIVVRLREPKVVYDLRNSRCLGRVTSFIAELRTGYANFYGLFDEPITTPSLKCGTSAKNNGIRLDADVSIPGAETTVLLELVTPTGERPLWARRVVNVRDGYASASWQLPLDEPTNWTLEARELFSGIVTRADVSQLTN